MKIDKKHILSLTAAALALGVISVQAFPRIMPGIGEKAFAFFSQKTHIAYSWPGYTPLFPDNETSLIPVAGDGDSVPDLKQFLDGTNWSLSGLQRMLDKQKGVTLKYKIQFAFYDADSTKIKTCTIRLTEDSVDQTNTIIIPDDDAYCS